MALAANVQRRSRIAIPSRPPPLRDSPNVERFTFRFSFDGERSNLCIYRYVSNQKHLAGQGRKSSSSIKAISHWEGTRESLDLPRFRTHPEIPRSFHAKLSLRALNEGAKGVIHIYIYVTRIYIDRARERIIPKGRGG